MLRSGGDDEGRSLRWEKEEEEENATSGVNIRHSAPHGHSTASREMRIRSLHYGCRRTSKKPYRRNCPTYRAPVYYGFIPDLSGIKKLLAGRTNSRANSSFLEVRRHP